MVLLSHSNLFAHFFLSGEQDLVQEVLSHLETLSQHVGMTAADILSRMKKSKLVEMMGAFFASGPERIGWQCGNMVKVENNVHASTCFGGGKA